jgi:hypothetical protein
MKLFYLIKAIMSILYFVLFITTQAFDLSNEISFNNSYIIPIEDRLINLTYSVNLSNNYSNVFMVQSSSINHAQYCLDKCTGLLLLNGTYPNLTIWSWGLSRLQYQINSTIGTDTVRQNKTAVYVILGLLIGFVIIIALFMPLWYCIGVSLCCVKNKKVNISQIYHRNN